MFFGANKQIYWTAKRLLAAAKLYNTRSDWKSKSASTYELSRIKGKEFFEKCCAHMKIRRQSWTDEQIIKEAKKYKTGTIWLKKSKNSYQAAYNRGLDFVSKCKIHMTHE